MIGGSQQARILRRALRDGLDLETAASVADMTLGEARLQQAEEARNPPPPEAYELLANVGHNQPPEDKTMAEATDDRLRLLIERIERLEEEKKGIGDDIKDVYGEGKSVGYDVKIMRRIVRLRKMKPDDRREAEQLMATYAAALGMDLQGSLF